MELAAAAFGVKLQYLDVFGSKDFETAFRAATKERADAVLVLQNGVLFSAKRDFGFCDKEPAPGDLLSGNQFVEDGGLMSYGASFRFGPARRYVCGQDSERAERPRIFPSSSRSSSSSSSI